MKILIFAILLGLCACDLPHGTGTGNPFGTPAMGQAPATVSGQVFVALCKMMEVCYPAITDQSCYTGIVDLTGFASKMGIRTVQLTAEQIMDRIYAL